MESLTAFKRAGADGILTYFALEAAVQLRVSQIQQDTVRLVSTYGSAPPLRATNEKPPCFNFSAAAFLSLTRSRMAATADASARHTLQANCQRDAHSGWDRKSRSLSN